jgi:dTDP-4-amino-4,6-dideoxygalactose transaminase
MNTHSIEFVDLRRQKLRLGDDLDHAIQRVMEHGHYIMGPEVLDLEQQLSQFCGVRHTLSSSNGTDALLLILMAMNVRAGDAVFCPSFTFAATAEMVALLGATPVFVDIQNHSFNMDADSLEAAVVTARQHGLRPAGVIPVDLFGLPAEYDLLEPVCSAHRMWMLCDAAQSFGAEFHGRRVGSIGLVSATSFFPAKPLGCYGDGGAIFTNDDDLASTIKSMRVHGQGSDKYDNVRIGINGRLDTLQAAILIEKFRIFPEEIRQRNVIAARYSEQLRDIVQVPITPPEVTSAWAQYTIRISGGRRDAIARNLKSKGIPTAVYYPKPLHQQEAYREFPIAGNGAPVSEIAASDVLSLPVHPYLTADEQDYVIESLVHELRTN